MTKEQVLLWGEDCMLWGSRDSQIAGVTYERQDQEWICTMAKNSCSVGFNIKIDKTYSKLDGHQQAGVVYLWLMVDVIVNITGVAKGLKEHIKLFGQKGLQGMYPMGENVERIVMDYTSICDTLDQ